MRNRHAFTLIDLLVVIVILFVLVVLLLSRLGKTGSVGDQIRCRGNLHSIGQALEMYAADAYPSEPFYPAGMNSGTAGIGLGALDLPTESLRCYGDKMKGNLPYAYCGTIALSEYAPDSGIVSDMRGNHEDFINILRADLSHVVPVDKPGRGDFRNTRLAGQAGY